ncbi:MAG: hypothetical protein CMP11_00510 [Zetaproteobacteria bacterium]|nr:hypothetical protein [Pseudobdellovibrionaceae bacterium]
MNIYKQNTIFSKLDWPSLLEFLASFCQTDEARKMSLNLSFKLTKDEILAHWNWIKPMVALAKLEQHPQIGYLESLDHIFKACSLGKVLEPDDFKLVSSQLESTQRVKEFLFNWQETCLSYKVISSKIVILKDLYNSLSRSLTDEGKVKDNASQELLKIRQKKKLLSRKIESTMKALIQGNKTYLQYLQDDFYTIRLNRYVVPIKLDGRGRINGHIIDTSASDQTLFIEPEEIRSLNEELEEIDALEKVEILLILRSLSTKIFEEKEHLVRNYHELIKLDFHTAQAILADKIKGQKVQLEDEPKINLLSVHHPLLCLSDNNSSVANDIKLDKGQNALVISGPNAGGKTVVLKTIGILQLMIKSGLLPPCSKESSTYVFNNIYAELGDAQSLSANLSSFSGHIKELKPIVEKAKKGDLVLLDEIASGTEPHAGSAIAQATLEHLNQNQVTFIVTTHFDNLKLLALTQKNFRNGSMEYDLNQSSSTYKLLLDSPGQSFGLEVAQELGFPRKIIERAQNIKGFANASIEKAIKDLNNEKSLLVKEKTNLSRIIKKNKIAEEELKEETKKLKSYKDRSVKKIVKMYEEKIQNLVIEIEASFKEIKKFKKDVSKIQQFKPDDLKEKSKRSIKAAQEYLDKISKKHHQETTKPGKETSIENLKKGDKVYLTDIGKSAVVSEIKVDVKKVFVKAGSFHLAVSIDKLRILEKYSNKPEKQLIKKSKNLTKEKNQTNILAQAIFQTPSNSIDVRGKLIDEALSEIWKTMDNMILSGRRVLFVIHGHGTGALKDAIRTSLLKNCPYDVRFHPAEKENGGDGTTVIFFES